MVLLLIGTVIVTYFISIMGSYDWQQAIPVAKQYGITTWKAFVWIRTKAV